MHFFKYSLLVLGVFLVMHMDHLVCNAQSEEVESVVGSSESQESDSYAEDPVSGEDIHPAADSGEDIDPEGGVPSSDSKASDGLLINDLLPLVHHSRVKRMPKFKSPFAKKIAAVYAKLCCSYYG